MMMNSIIRCPKCGRTWNCNLKLDSEAFGDTSIIQTYVEFCHDCGLIFTATDHFTLTDTTYELV